MGRAAKIMQTAAVIAALVIAYMVYGAFDPSFLFDDGSAPVGMDQIQAAGQQGCTGKTAGRDIPRIEGQEAFEEMDQGAYMTVSPQQAIPTGVYSLRPWVDPYSITKTRTSSGRMRTTGRRAPEITTSPGIHAGDYQEYHLVRLQDGSYIVAQLGGAHARAVENGKEIDLRIGQKRTNTEQARAGLKEICGQYGAADTYMLYMVDDGWEEAHSFSLFMIRSGASLVVFFLLSIGAFLAIDRSASRKGAGNV